MKNIDEAYEYDGSFDGLMCCVFESVYKKEIPAAILTHDSEQGVIYPIREIETDVQKATRVISSVPKKMNSQALENIRLAYLTCMAEKELNILKYMHLGYRVGSDITKRLTDETVWTVERAVGFLTRESHLFKGFVRFSDFGGVLVAEIEPKNFVLPIIAPHFDDRLGGERFLIYDKTHGMAAVGQQGKWKIVPMESFTMPLANAKERVYQDLWREFYNTVAIEGRYNSKCRMGHMPKRYWDCMTEFQAPVSEKNRKEEISVTSTKKIDIS